MSSPVIDRAARALAIAAPLGAAAYAALRSGDVLLGGAAWLVVLAACLAGYGHAVERVLRLRVDLGLRLAWGAAAYLVVAGWLLAAGVLTQSVLAALVALGVIGYAWRQVTVDEPALVALVRWLPAIRRRPHAIAMYALVAVIAAVNVGGALAEMQGNVYDDDVIYTPMVRRLLDIGDLDEPFSFRRISAYGGQTVLQALAAVRGTLANLYLVDGALFQVILLLLIAGMARDRDGEARGVDDFVLALSLLAVVLLPDMAINTGSYWTGVVLFLALYRTACVVVEDVGHDARDARFALIGVVGAGACTLRQSYLPAAGLFVVLLLLMRGPIRRPLWRERGVWLWTVAGALVALVPYWIATWRSNQTFLYPFWLGTFNPDVQMQPTLFSPWQEIQFFVKVMLEPDPFRAFLPLVPVLVLARDARPGRPLTALTIASAVGFVLLVHSFTLSDARNLWRYSFGYSFSLVLVLVLEAGRQGLRPDDGAPVRVPLIGRIVVVACLLIQLAVSGRGIARKYADLAGDLQAAASASRHGARTAETERLYRALQASVPAGATVAMLLDEPYHFDYARNRFINLDTPGFASFRPGMPFFEGPAPVIDYFLSHGIRYLAFVRGDHSRYMFRRDYWVHRLLRDTELWRIQGAYTVDCLDNFAAIAAQRAIRFEQDGLVLVDLAEAR